MKAWASRLLARVRALFRRRPRSSVWNSFGGVPPRGLSRAEVKQYQAEVNREAAQRRAEAGRVFDALAGPGRRWVLLNRRWWR